MNKLIVLSILLGIIFQSSILFSQKQTDSKQPISLVASFSWNDESGLPYHQETDGVYSFSDFYYHNDGHVDFLCNMDNQIRSIYPYEKSNQNKLLINSVGELFTFSDGKFFVIQNKKIQVIGSDGEKINEVLLPKSVVSPEKLFADNNKLVIWNSDQSSLVIDPMVVASRPEMSLNYLISGNGLQSKIQKINSNTFKIELKKDNEVLIDKTINTTQKIGSVRISGVTGNYLVIDRETIIKDVPLEVKREIVLMNYTDLNSDDIVVELPNIYYTYIKQDMKVIDGNLYFMLSAPDNAKLFLIEPAKFSKKAKTAIKLPGIDYSAVYHFNNHLKKNDEPKNTEQGLIYKSTKDGAIYRSQIIAIAKTYEEHYWTANANNIGYVSASCGGSYYTTPTWVQLGTNLSIPYMWGGFSSLTQYDQGMIDGKSAGDMNTTSVASSCCVGVDCSGYVSRAWDQSSKYGTSTLPGISTAYASFDDLLPGDIVNYAGSHVRLVYTLNGNGTVTVLEATGSGWIVKYSTYTYTALQTNYIPRYYNQVVNDIVMPPELVTPVELASDVQIPVPFDWTENPSATVYTIQVSLSNTSWTPADGFTSSASPSASVPVNYETGSITDFDWSLSSPGVFCAPTPNTLYYWSVRCFVPGSGYSVYTQPRRFTSLTDNNAPGTYFSLNTWETNDFSVQFTDTDDIAIKYRFYNVADNNYNLNEWRSNGDRGYFYDSFDQATLHPDWTIVDGTWSVVSNSLNQSDQSLTYNNVYAMIDQNNSYVYLYNWKMNISGSNSTKRAGIYIFCDEPTYLQRNNSYMIYFRADDKCQIYKAVNDVINIQADVVCTVNENTMDDYKVLFNPVTGEIDVFINDVFVASWTDPSPHQTGNSISLRTGNANAYYDDFKIYKSRIDQADIVLGASGDIRYVNKDPFNPAGLVNSMVCDYGDHFSMIAQQTVNIDTSIPEDFANVNDGTGSDIDTTWSLVELSANWPAAVDTNSGIGEYQFAIGTTPGGNEIMGWTSNSINTVVTQNGLSLIDHSIYYISVRAVNGAGLIGNVATSNGQLALQPSDVKELAEMMKIKIYPNPAFDYIIIELPINLINSKIDIFSIQGKVIKSLKTTDSIITIDLNNLSSGVYLIGIQSESGFVMKKLIKQ
ncbi:MAG: T9SS type A sorting domain-containing protein [Bacteroidota bacterium]